MIDIDLSPTEEIHKWFDLIPDIELPRGYKIRPLPPFLGAVVRFMVTKPNGQTASVYLDCYDKLGCYGSSYWEVHPYDGDVGRCDMADVNTLVDMIKKSKS